MEKHQGKVTWQNLWLLQRGKLFERYALHIPERADEVGIQLDYPDNGWIDFHVLINGEEKALINTSYVYEPFINIKEWLETIVSHVFDFTPCGVNLYDESYNYIMYYEPILFLTDELLTPTPPSLCGLFYIYDGYERKIVADAYCETKAFVRQFYESILSFAEAAREHKDFVEDWIQSAYNEEWGQMDDDDPRIKDIFINKVKSKKIEAFLYDEKSTTRFIPIKLNRKG